MRHYINKNDSVLGPYSTTEINKFIEAGVYEKTDFACAEGCAEWIPLGSVAGVSFLNQPIQKQKEAVCGTAILACGYSFAGIGIFFLPIIFSVLAGIFGIIAMSKGKEGHGTAILILALLGFVGWIIWLMIA